MNANDEILAFGSESEAVKWLITAYLEQGKVISQLKEDNAAMVTRINLLEENAEIHARILAKLKGDTLQPAQQDRREVLLALLEANGGKMPAKVARQKMRLTKPLFSQLIATMTDVIDTKPLHYDQRQKLLVLV